MKANQFYRNLLFVAASVLVILGAMLMLRDSSGSEPIQADVTTQLPSSESLTTEDQTLETELQASMKPSLLSELAVLTAENSSDNLSGSRPAAPPTYSQRIVALHAIQSEDLDDETQSAVLEYLRRPTGQPRNGRPDLVEASIKNDLIEWLRNRRPAIQELTSTLLSIVGDPEQPVVMRDYALQHLGSWGRTLNELSNDWQAEALEMLTEGLWEAVGDPNYSYAGTALLSLRRLKNADDQRLKAQSLRIASNERYSSLSRATALQVLGGLDPTAALLVAEKTADIEAPPELRLAAIAVIGAYADSESFLGSRGFNNDPRYGVAVMKAREQIEKRLQENGGEG